LNKTEIYRYLRYSKATSIKRLSKRSFTRVLGKPYRYTEGKKVEEEGERGHGMD
jgi:hypothetical protein